MQNKLRAVLVIPRNPNVFRYAEYKNDLNYVTIPHTKK